MSQGKGGRTGSAGVASDSIRNAARKKQLAELAREVIDLKNDPYFLQNHLGSYECKLCLTLHLTEGSYLAHTQGKKHQQNLARRNAMMQRERGDMPTETRKIAPRKIVKIGKPGFKVVKQRDARTNQLSLLFQLQYPSVAEGVQPRFRFMSAYEQKVERIDARYQYLLVAAEPYETVAFKIPNLEIDRSPGRLFTHWDTEKLTYTLQLYFKRQQRGQQQQQLLQLQQQQREQAARAAAGEGSTDMVDG